MVHIYLFFQSKVSSIDVPDFFFQGEGQRDPLEFRKKISGGGPGGKSDFFGGSPRGSF